MTRQDKWIVGVTAVGLAAGLAAVALFWIVVTRPLAVAEVIAAGF